MLEQQKKQQVQQVMKGADSSANNNVATSQSHPKTQSSSSNMAHQRTSSNQKSTAAVVHNNEEAKYNHPPEKKAAYGQARPESSHAGSETLYQKAQAKAQSMMKQGSNYAGPAATKTSSNTHSYGNPYSSQPVYGSKPSTSQGSSGIGGYSKTAQTTGQNFVKKK